MFSKLLPFAGFLFLIQFFSDAPFDILNELVVERNLVAPYLLSGVCFDGMKKVFVMSIFSHLFLHLIA